MSILELFFGKDMLRMLRRRRWIRGARSGKPVSATTQGPALLKGRVRPIETLVRAPFTQGECAFWLARLESKVWIDHENSTFGGRDSKMEWREEFRVASTVPFELVDASGVVVRIDLGDVFYEMPLLSVTEDPHVNDDNPMFDAFLRQNGVVPTAFMGIAGDTHFFEERIDTGDVISVYGRISTTSSVRAEGYRDAPDTMLRMVGTFEEPIVILPG